MLKFSPKIRLGMLINVMLIKKNVLTSFFFRFLSENSTPNYICKCKTLTTMVIKTVSTVRERGFVQCGHCGQEERGSFPLRKMFELFVAKNPKNKTQQLFAYVIAKIDTVDFVKLAITIVREKLKNSKNQLNLAIPITLVAKKLW